MMFNILTLLTLALWTAQPLVRADPSAVPYSGYTCPTADSAGFSLATPNYATEPIFCSYPAVAGENPNDFYCTYSSTTGQLVTDNDAGFCPGNGVAHAVQRRRSDKLPLPSRPLTSRGIPAGRSDKAYLKKRRV
ncbi:hypothetical protein HYPSUDRAFT_81168 [Hypholoma sublateritium FD-334 SS-4]|uniref:Uncharacterized protein n=1 Tax=Hypholoma sublateritium (strain FD-334 SS-4) TaxID=945553 RepID=A0A0D2LQK5_HYPSF|nr:hypothetical protein HYPSUDRAFT_81168 [Hypholoma sublateritium FD-334 SS-4]